LARLAALCAAGVVISLTGGSAWASPAPQPVSGALAVAGKVDLGPAVGHTIYQLVDAEAPNGNFYYSFGSTIEVVKGDAAPAKVISTKGVLALAATASDLYVETGLTVSDYSLPAVTLHRTWTLPVQRSVPAHAIPTSGGLIAGGGALWSWTDWETDGSGLEPANLLELTSAATPRLIDDNAYPGFMAAGTTGLYYENLAGHLVYVAANGSRVVSHEAVPTDAPIVVESSSVLLFAVAEPSGTPLLDRYDAATLDLQASLHPKNLAGDVTETSLGLLGLVCEGASCASSDVGRFDPLTATTGDALSVPGLETLVQGVDPAALAQVSGRAWLVRLELASGAGASSAVPVLGAASFHAPSGVGWGKVAPREIFNGGDPSGEVDGIIWAQWGKPAADGYGEGYIFRPTGGYYPAVEVEVQAFALGHCSQGGPLAYTRLEVRVPSRPGGALGAWQAWGGGSGSICSEAGM
jgi:hypothetical protein